MAEGFDFSGALGVVGAFTGLLGASYSGQSDRAAAAAQKSIAQADRTLSRADRYMAVAHSVARARVTAPGLVSPDRSGLSDISAQRQYDRVSADLDAALLTAGVRGRSSQRWGNFAKSSFQTAKDHGGLDSLNKFISV